MSGALTATVTVGSRLWHDGQWFTVTGIEAERLRLRTRGGETVLVHTGTVLGEASTRVEGSDDGSVPAVGPVLDDLDAAQRAAWQVRLGHVRELLTGFASGMPEAAVEEEPRPEYDPGLSLKRRYAAKAAELGVTVRTLERWVAELRQAGPAGLVDGRGLRRGEDPLAGVDPRWLAMARTVLAEHVDASRPTRTLVLQRVAERARAEHGEDVVVPGRRRAERVLAELTRGTNAFTGSTKAKRSIARGPHGVYGRLRACRPGEHLLLDSTPLDVFAMEPVTLRWVRVELTVAMDLYSRVIVGLRLAPVSTKSVDAALVLFEALRPDSRRRTGEGLLPYAGLPDLVVVAGHDDQDSPDGGTRAGRGLPGVAAETIVVDHGKIYISQHLLAVCDRLGISVQPARPLTPTDKAAVERYFRTLREQLLEALPGYKGPDVHSRGADPEGCAYFFIDELEQVVREWTGGIYHHRPHSGLADPWCPAWSCPRRRCSPTGCPAPERCGSRRGRTWCWTSCRPRGARSSTTGSK